MRGRANNFVDPTGKKYITNEGYEVTIIGYDNSNNCTIMFDDDKNTVISGVSHYVVKEGKVKNLNKKSVYGTGYFGIGKYTSKGRSLDYYTWKDTLRRCYSLNQQKKQPTYRGVLMSEEWHNFQNFGAWFEQNNNPSTMKGWQLDKDILVKDNKVYSAETCCFVPQEINNLFTKGKKCRGDYPIGVIKRGENRFEASTRKSLGCFKTPNEAYEVYKAAKEKYIKEVANKWKDLIDPRVYKAMYNYEVEITD